MTYSSPEFSPSQYETPDSDDEDSEYGFAKLCLVSLLESARVIQKERGEAAPRDNVQTERTTAELRLSFPVGPQDSAGFAQVHSLIAQNSELIDFSTLKAALHDVIRKRVKQEIDSFLSERHEANLHSVANDPDRLQRLTVLATHQFLRGALDKLKLPPSEIAKFRSELARGEVSDQLVMNLLEQEKTAKTMGPVTCAMIDTLINRTATLTEHNAATLVRNGQKLAKGFPDSSVTSVAPDQILSAANLSNLEMLEKAIKWNAAISKGRDPELTKLQQTLLTRIEKLTPRELSCAIRDQAKLQLKENFEQGTLAPETIGRLRDAQLTNRLDRELEKLAEERLSELLRTLEGKDGGLIAIAALKSDNISTEIVRKMLACELSVGIEGSITRGVSSALLAHQSETINSIYERFPGEQKNVPTDIQIPDDLITKSVPGDRYRRLNEQIVQKDLFIERAMKETNPAISELHETMLKLLPGVEPNRLHDRLTKVFSEQLLNEFRQGKLQAPTLTALERARNSGKLNEKIAQLAEAKIQTYFAVEINKLKSSTMPANEIASMEKMLKEQQIPEDLLRLALDREVKSNSFGPITRATYAALVSSMETKVSAQLVALGKIGAQIPADCPIPLGMNNYGRPRLTESIGMAATYNQAEERDFRNPPDQTDLQRLMRSVQWTRDASKVLHDYSQNFQAIALTEMCQNLKRNSWCIKEGDDRDHWIAKVGSLIEMNMQVKACAQALHMAMSMDRDSALSFDPEALAKRFPGRIKFDDQTGKVIDIEIDWPDTLDGTIANRQKLERVAQWLKENEGPAKQIINELAAAAADNDRILLWADVPGNGVTNDGLNERKFNLSRYRFSVEEVVGSDGTKKIRVQNFCDRYYSERWNYQDIGARPISRETFKDKPRDGQDYRDYAPHDMVAISVDNQIQLLRADELESWRAATVRWQIIDKGVSMSLDAGMCISGAVHVSTAAKAMKVAARVDSATAMGAAMKKAAQDAIGREKFAAFKSFSLGGSGFVVNNSNVASDPFGSNVIKGRHWVFVADGANTFCRLSKSGLGKIGFLSKPASLPGIEGRATRAVESVIQKWTPPDSALRQALFHTAKILAGPYGVNTWSLLASEGYLAWTLGKHVGEEVLLSKHSPDLAKALRLARKVESNGEHAGRLLRSMADNISAGDPVLAGQLRQVTDNIKFSPNLPGEERDQQIKRLVSEFDACQEKRKKFLLACCLIVLSQNEQGKVPDTIAMRDVKVKKAISGAPYVHGSIAEYEVIERHPLTAAALFKEVEDFAGKSGTTENVLIGQFLVSFGKMQLPEFATACKAALADPKTDKNVKQQCIVGLGLCIDGATTRNQNHLTADEKAQAMMNAFGVSHQQMVDALEDAAGKDGDAEVRAMSTKFLFALKQGDERRKEQLIAECIGGWRYAKLQQEMKSLEHRLQNSEFSQQAVKSKLAEKQSELDALHQQLTLLKKPELAIKLLDRQAEFEKERETQSIALLALAQKNRDIDVGLLKLAVGDPQRKVMEAERKRNLQEQDNIREKLQSATLQLQSIKLDNASLVAMSTLEPAQMLSPLTDELIAPLPVNPKERELGAYRKLLAIELLEQAHQVPVHEINRKYINQLVELVDMENGGAAVTALARLLPVEQHLTAEQKSKVSQVIFEILGREHRLRGKQETSDENFDPQRQSANTKENLLYLVPALFKSNLFGISQKHEFVKSVGSLIDVNGGTAMFASDHPQLRAAAITALGESGIKNEQVRALLERSLRPATSDGAGEPSSIVRLAALQALQKLEYQDLGVIVAKFRDNETDPGIQSEYAALTFESLRPDRPECAQLIYQAEVAFWEDVLLRSKSRIDPEKVNDYLKTNFPRIHADTYTFVVKQEAAEKHAARREEIIGSSWYSFFSSRTNKDLSDVDTARAEELYGGREWAQLIQHSRSTGSTGDLARAALLHLATKGTSAGEATVLSAQWQLAAAREIRTLIKTKACPNKEELFHGMIEAWSNDNTPSKRDVRAEFIAMFHELLDSKPPGIPKQLAGRIVHDALRYEMRRMHENSANDRFAMLQQLELIKLLEKCDYPLAMAQLQAIAAGRADGKPLHCRAEVREAARRFYQRLQATAPSAHNDQEGRAESLRLAIAARGKTRAATEELKGKSFDQIAERSHELKMDGISTRNAIVENCGRVIVLNDLRIPHLQTLLNDPDKGVAVTAAWYLVNAANPIHSNDARVRNTLMEQVWYQDAVKKLREVAESEFKDPTHAAARQAHEQWKTAALRYLTEIKYWGVFTGARKRENLTAAQHSFEEAKICLEGVYADHSVDSKKRAIRRLVRLAADAYFSDDLEMQRQAQSLLQQVAATKDAVLGKVAEEAIKSVREQYKPVSDHFVGYGRRELSFANKGTTVITYDSSLQTITYPDKSWLAFHYDEQGKIASYSSSSFTGRKTVGKDFAPGAVAVSGDGTVVFSDAAGKRRIVSPSGDNWTFYSGQPDLSEAARQIKAGLESPRTPSALLESVTDATNFDGIPLVGADDPRVPAIQLALRHKDAKVRVAAARVLLMPENTGLTNEVLGEARTVYLKEQLPTGFLISAPAQATDNHRGHQSQVTAVLRGMEETMKLIGPIRNGEDPRIKFLTEALHHEHAEARLQAAFILCSTENTGVDRKTKEMAAKLALQESIDAWKIGASARRIEAAGIINKAAKDLGTFELRGENGRVMYFKNGELSRIQLPDGQSVEVEQVNGIIKSIKMPRHSLTFSKKLDNGFVEWRKPDGQLWNAKVYVSPDGSFGWSDHQDFRHYGADGSVTRKFERSWNHSGGSHRITRSGESLTVVDESSVYGKDSRCFGDSGNTRKLWVSPTTGKTFVFFSKSGMTEELQPGDFVDERGTHFKRDAATGTFTGDTVSGATLKMNSTGLLLERSFNGAQIKLTYKPGTNIVGSVEFSDGTTWQRSADRWQVRSAESPHWKPLDGDVSVSATGEFTRVRPDGTSDVYKLNGTIETLYPNGGMITRQDGRITRILRTNGLEDNFEWREVVSGPLVVKVKSHKGSYYERRGSSTTWDEVADKRTESKQFDLSIDESGTVHYTYADQVVSLTIDGKQTVRFKTQKLPAQAGR